MDVKRVSSSLLMQRCRRNGFLSRRMKKKVLCIKDEVRCVGGCIKSMDTNLWLHTFVNRHFAQYVVTLYGIYLVRWLVTDTVSCVTCRNVIDLKCLGSLIQAYLFKSFIVTSFHRMELISNCIPVNQEKQSSAFCILQTEMMIWVRKQNCVPLVKPLGHYAHMFPSSATHSYTLLPT